MNVVGNIFLLGYTLICYFLCACVAVFTVIPLIFLLLILPAHVCHTSRLVFFLLDCVYKGVIGSLLVPITIVGEENIPAQSAIIVANHQSALDIPLLGSVLQKHPHVWYALSYYAGIPVLGFFIRRLGISVDRDNGSTAAKSLRQGVKFAQSHTSNILIFPEGGRFIDEEIHPFLQGFAFLARTTKRPVVPVYMPYNGYVYPPHSFFVYRHQLEVVVGPQFVYNEHDTDEEFVARVHAWFVHESRRIKNK